jgi:LAGLIDADG DNA endonuclease family
MEYGRLIKNRGIKLSTNCFILSEIKILVSLWENKYKLKVTIYSTGTLNQYNIYIQKSNLPVLIPLILPYIHPYFLYKLKFFFIVLL